MAGPDCLIPVYLDASWKGVPFVVLTSSDEFGRRGDQYEYPLSEDTAYKDLGRKIRKFRIEGYLIGGDQVEKSVRMARAAESPGPGTLVHPMFGSIRVACVTLKISAEYKTDIRRTRLDFDFVEANESMAPYLAGASVQQVFASGSQAVNTAKAVLPWAPTADALAASQAISANLAGQIEPATDEESFDAISVLTRTDVPVFGVSPAELQATRLTATVAFEETLTRAGYLTFAGVVNPIDEGTAEVRRLHLDAMKRLRAFNLFVVEQSQPNEPSIESLIVAARLSLIRDYALTALQHTYATVSEALIDLDFVMAVYDDEERAATQHCYDVLITAIRQARADSVRSILAKNVRLPGIVRQEVYGQWPSLVAAQKLYADGRRYQEVESYNQDMSPFYLGRDLVAPAS